MYDISNTAISIPQQNTSLQLTLDKLMSCLHGPNYQLKKCGMYTVDVSKHYFTSVGIFNQTLLVRKRF